MLFLDLRLQVSKLIGIHEHIYIHTTLDTD